MDKDINPRQLADIRAYAQDILCGQSPYSEKGEETLVQLAVYLVRLCDEYKEAQELIKAYDDWY